MILTQRLGRLSKTKRRRGRRERRTREVLRPLRTRREKSKMMIKKMETLAITRLPMGWKTDQGSIPRTASDSATILWPVTTCKYTF